jgi:hypothetical protein
VVQVVVVRVTELPPQAERVILHLQPHRKEIMAETVLQQAQHFLLLAVAVAALVV